MAAISPTPALVGKPMTITALDEIKSGAFKRTASAFRNSVSAEPDAQYPLQSGRYHLYVSHACPWAHRCLITRSLKNLDKHIAVTAVAPTWKKTRPDDPMDSHWGWAFAAPGTRQSNEAGHGNILADEECSVDPLHREVTSVRDLYELASPGYTGKPTVPVLFDTVTSTIVNNESSEIVRMFNTVFATLNDGDATIDIYKEELRSAIDGANEWIYPQINDGVYRCGFAQSQESYDSAVTSLFQGLDKLEALLEKQRYVASSAAEGITEADVRLYPTCVRFDEVYVVYFKCNMRQLSSYPAIRGWLREMYQMDAFKSTTNMDHIKTHYFTSHAKLNTFAVVPVGPGVIADLSLPHGREAVL